MLFFNTLWQYLNFSNNINSTKAAKNNKSSKKFFFMNYYYFFVETFNPVILNLKDLVSRQNYDIISLPEGKYHVFQSTLFNFITIIRKVRYFIHNWIYTTNHKRIGMNYFNFVLVSGTAGMALASIIRAELAYPGKGIMMGDSIQYLTFATGHGVIMVFFMIMPTLAGAFGNFLLPTQLGVHDVAFPRLNSASFWFLPGGLLMLCHLVCTDKKYSKLNYFNIKQYQGLIRHRHFAELINGNEHHTILNPTMTAVRFKLNGHNATEQNIMLFYRYGITNLSKPKNINFKASYSQNYNMLNKNNINTFFFTKFNNFFTHKNYLYTEFCFVLNLVNSFYNLLLSSFYYVRLNYVKNNNLTIHDLINTPNMLVEYFTSLFSILFINFKSYFIHTSWQLSSSKTNLNTFLSDFFIFTNENLINVYIYKYLLNIEVLFTAFKNVLEINLFFSFKHLFSNLNYFNLNNSSYMNVYNTVNVSSENITAKNSFTQINSNFFELSNYYRFLNASDTRINIMTKQCNILSPWVKAYPFTHDMVFAEYPMPDTTRKAYWHFNPARLDLIHKYFNVFKSKFLINPNFSVANEEFKEQMYTKTFFLPFDSFFNFSYVLENSFYNIQSRWISIHALDNKFYRMFHTNTLQDRILSKWRELKFTREAWRCKRLVGRNQNPRYIKKVDPYVNNITFVRQRTNKDLIPGWAMITPFSSRTKFTLIGKVDIGCIGVWLALNASIISSINFLITYRYLSTLNNRKMRDARSFFTESIIVTAWMMLAANPMFAIGLLMIVCDRHWKTSFFDYSGGGDSVLFQHMFWFFGHPEVYIVVIPVFGFANTIFSYYFRKRISARASLLYSMYTIAFLGFWVWGHHMYMVGLSHTTRMLFSTLTVMISVPASTKLMHWCVTIASSSFIIEVPVLFSMAFAMFFSTGGISGMGVAHVGTDVLFHDTFYVIGHFHMMFAAAAMSGIFGGFYFYFPALYGVKYSRIFAYMHLVYYVFGQILTIAPMIWLGYWGMPRRILDYPYSLGGWHSLSSVGHFVASLGIFCFYIMMYDSIRQSRAPLRNTFGFARFNTRLNFFMFEYYKLTYVNYRSWFMYRTPNLHLRSKQKVDYLRLVLINTTLFSYSFHK